MKKTFALFGILSLILSFTVGITSVYGDSEADFTLYKGWNLVSFPIIDDLEMFIFEDGYAMFAFNPIDKEYHGGIGQDVDLIIADMARSLGKDAYVLLTYAFWVYAPENKKVTFRSLTPELEEEVRESHYLYEGWNLMSLYSFVNGKLLNEFKGDCNIEKLYSFNNVKQEWVNLDFLIEGEDEFDGLVDSDGNIDDELGFGYAIRVSDDCRFDFTETSNIPSIPSLPN